MQISDTYVPRNALTDNATAMGVWTFYTLFVVAAFFLEKTGRHAQTRAL